MNKRTLKTYLDNSMMTQLKTGCVEYGKQFATTDSFSIVIMNSNNDLNILTDKWGIASYCDTFKENYTNFIKVNDLDFTKEDYKIEEGWGIDLKRLKRLKTLINAKNIDILKTTTRGLAKYLIKLENEKTGEVAYLLPTKIY